MKNSTLFLAGIAFIALAFAGGYVYISYIHFDSPPSKVSFDNIDFSPVNQQQEEGLFVSGTLSNIVSNNNKEEAAQSKASGTDNAPEASSVMLPNARSILDNPNALHCGEFEAITHIAIFSEKNKKYEEDKTLTCMGKRLLNCQPTSAYAKKAAGYENGLTEMAFSFGKTANGCSIALETPKGSTLFCTLDKDTLQEYTKPVVVVLDGPEEYYPGYAAAGLFFGFRFQAIIFLWALHAQQTGVAMESEEKKMLEQVLQNAERLSCTENGLLQEVHGL